MLGNEIVELPVAWILTIIGTLAGVIATLAGLIWTLLKTRLAAQDRIIESLQRDVDRLSKGCGATECMWRMR